MSKTPVITPFHQLLIDIGGTAETIKKILDAHEAVVASHTTEVDKLKADHKTEVDKLLDDHKSETDALNAKVQELSSKVEETERVTPGEFTSKESKKTYKFTDGILDFVFLRSGSSTAQTFLTKEALKDKALMEELISIGAGIIEEVNS